VRQETFRKLKKNVSKFTRFWAILRKIKCILLKSIEDKLGIKFFSRGTGYRPIWSHWQAATTKQESVKTTFFREYESIFQTRHFHASASDI
jgi:hypothetical protein